MALDNILQNYWIVSQDLKVHKSPGWVTQLVDHCPDSQGCGFDPRSGTYKNHPTDV